NYLLSNIWLQYQIGDVVLKATLGYNTERLTQNYFSGAYTSLGLATEGVGGVGYRSSEIWQQEYTATYDKNFGENHHLDVLAGFTRQSSTSTFSNIRTNHFTNEILKQYNLGDGAGIYTPQTGIRESYLNSIIARANYTLLDRYNVTGTFRADNSSRFAKTHRWGIFPSLGLSWNIDKERFLDNAQSVDYLKLRVSAGVVGNQEIPDYSFTTSYATGSYGGSSSYNKNTAANDGLKWETTASYNAGVDMGLFKNRLTFVADVYYKKTSDLLLQVPVGFSSGVTTQMQNVGNVVNKGVEFSVNAVCLERKNLRWDAGINLAHNSNNITGMGTADNILQGPDKQQILRKGESLGSFYGLLFDGIVQQNEDVTLLPTINGNMPSAGDPKFVDVNHDNKIDGNDRVILCSIQPKLTYGITSHLGWKQLDVSLVFAGNYGSKLYNALGRRLEQTGDSYNVLSSVGNSWTPDNGANTLPLASTSRPFSYIDSRYVQTASYLKLRNLTVSYRLPLRNSFPLGIRLHATASNLFTLTPYKGYDPEVSGGTDAGAYPSNRSFVFGVNLTL
ncbi:MAG: SusC/RagA family TonB-linked outer membrane protein, partial [Bacteroidaceae bacterium]